MEDPEIASPPASSEELHEPPSSPDLRDTETIWLENLEAARRQSLANANPMMALIGTQFCDVVGTGHHWQRIVDTLLEREPKSLKLVERLRPLMDTTAKFSRQAAQLARITRQEAPGETSSR
jgi:hypothetical protein